jgi:hypothetical protein
MKRVVTDSNNSTQWVHYTQLIPTVCATPTQPIPTRGHTIPIYQSTTICSFLATVKNRTTMAVYYTRMIKSKRILLAGNTLKTVTVLESSSCTT